MTPRFVTTPIAASLLVLSLAGCADSGVEQIPPDAKSAISALAVTAPEVELAVKKASVDCLREAGFDVPFSPAMVSWSMTSISGVAGLRPSAEQARSQGYPSTVRPSDAPDDLESFIEALTPRDAARFHEVYVGGSDAPRVTITSTSGSTMEQSGAGCLAEANKRVFGSVKASLEVQAFGNEVLTASGGVAIVQALRDHLPDYESCMREHDYPVEGLTANQLALARFGAYRAEGQPPSPEEASMAEQDARCQAQAGLIAADERAMYEAAAKWILTHEEFVLARKAQLEVALANAQEVLAG